MWLAQSGGVILILEQTGAHTMGGGPYELEHAREHGAVAFGKEHRTQKASMQNLLVTATKEGAYTHTRRGAAPFPLEH
jgi:hypothetical protein